DAPLAEAHACGLLEQAAEGALPGPDAPTELFQRGRVLHLLLHEVGERPEPLVARLGQVERLLRGGGEIGADGSRQLLPALVSARGASPESGATASTEACAGRSPAEASAMNTLRMSVAPCARC